MELPDYLKQYVSQQNYEAYTHRDQAVWRFIMKQNVEFFKTYAVEPYVAGLEKTGVPIEEIPHIERMNDALEKFGWSAVAVCGFIPPSVFIDFQARGILPIATDMRTVEHIGYTPAPDIVHEAAGHAPILADPAYAAYLKAYGSLASKAIMSKEDIEVYEAIRYLSDVKEDPNVSPDILKSAETKLKQAQANISFMSEASKLSRLFWWTAEYGLVGDLNQPRIYGAGLLSSVWESQNCLKPAVNKVPLTAACVEISYNITEPQPQLFVAKSLESLPEVVAEVEKHMSFRVGGSYGLGRAKQAKSLATVVLDTGVSMSGILNDYEKNQYSENIDFIKFTGPTQLAIGVQEIDGHGVSRHPEGFSAVLGAIVGLEKPVTGLGKDDLKSLGIVAGNQTQIKFKSGFEIKGRVTKVEKVPTDFFIVTWKDCTVRRGEKVYFQPEWGEFDQVFGKEVHSVYGGVADPANYGAMQRGEASTKPGIIDKTLDPEVDKMFATIRGVRSKSGFQQTALEELKNKFLSQFKDQWLLGLELLEYEVRHTGMEKGGGLMKSELYVHLESLKGSVSSETADMISKGVGLLGLLDVSNVGA